MFKKPSHFKLSRLTKNKGILVGLGVGATLSLAGYVAYNNFRKSVKPMDPDLAHQASKIMFEDVKNALVISPHPDDFIFFAGGTIKKLVNQGIYVTVVDVCEGEKGAQLVNYGSQRRDTQIRSQKQLGYGDLRFLHYPQFNVDQTQLMLDLRNIWHEINPDLVITFDPHFPLRAASHPDHMTVGKSALQLASDIGDNTKLYLYGSRKNTILVDIEETIEDKTRAYLYQKVNVPVYRNFYTKSIYKMARLSASNSSISLGESFRAFHNIHSFPY
ncbi:PIG-L family deacetylase [Proteinivorax hydrogeniformans]|uniref:PIG-L family deacetylase n=1 Tax=Proteinivorax hydrogeniformans TaxID=1826727 RepID=A0AAU8HVU4_9FIRM